MKIKAVAALAALPLFLVSLAACSPAAGGAGGSPSAAKETTVTDIDWRTALAGCMRDKGHDFPDPDPSGGGQGLTIDGDQAAWSKDYDACSKATNDKLGEVPVSGEQKKANEEGYQDELAYAQCLRKKGYEISDPERGGSGRAFGGGTDEAGKKIATPDEQACSSGVTGDSQ